MNTSSTARQLDRLVSNKAASIAREFDADPLMMPWLQELLTQLSYQSIDIALENATADAHGAALSSPTSPVNILRTELQREGTLANQRARNKK